MATDVTVAPTLGHPILLTQGGVGATPGYDAIDLRRMIQAASGGQEGVYDATGWKVRERAAGPNMTIEVDANVGIAQVKGESVTHQGPYVVAPHSAVITLDVATAHSTNPRVDMVILHVRDNTHDALGANDARVRILSGTATAGATLDNLNGSPSLPSNAIRLADVLVPAADTTISNSQIRDRRPWARGANHLGIRNTGVTLSTTAGWQDIDNTNFLFRVETTGVPLFATISHFGMAMRAVMQSYLGVSVDAATPIQGVNYYQGDANAKWIPGGWTIPLLTSGGAIPAAGSHTFKLQGQCGSVASTDLNSPITFGVYEQIRPSSNNGAT